MMEDGRAYIQIVLDTEQPVELADFVGAFAAIGAQYDRFIRNEHPELAPDARIFVKQVREGSIEADLIPVIAPFIHSMDTILIVDAFVRRIGNLIGYYTNPKPGVLPAITKSEIKELMDGIAAVAHDPNGRAVIKSIAIDRGEKRTRAAV